MKLGQIALTLALVCTQAGALEVAAPKGSPLRESPDKSTAEYLHKFRGKVTLVGTFIARWVLVPVLDDENSKEQLTLQAVFTPSQSSAKLLPHFKGRAPVKELYLQPAQEAISLLISPQNTKALLSQEVVEVTGSASLTIEAYTAEITCDAPAYSAHLVSVKQLSAQLVAKQAPKASATGC